MTLCSTLYWSLIMMRLNRKFEKIKTLRTESRHDNNRYTLSVGGRLNNKAFEFEFENNFVVTGSTVDCHNDPVSTMNIIENRELFYANFVAIGGTGRDRYPVPPLTTIFKFGIMATLGFQWFHNDPSWTALWITTHLLSIERADWSK